MLWNKKKVDLRIHAAIVSFDPFLLLSSKGRFIYASRDYTEGEILAAWVTKLESNRRF
jgi:hypothetical protein